MELEQHYLENKKLFTLKSIQLKILIIYKMKVFEKLQNKFQLIFMLNLSTRGDRRHKMIQQLFDFGLPNNFRQSDLDIRTTVPFKRYNTIMMHVLNQNKLGRLTKPNEYDCTHNHYSMIKQAYDQGCQYCLIMEDDILFIKDEKLWEKYLDNIPGDFDILQFGGFTADKLVVEEVLNHKDEYWVKHPHVGIWTTAMYALSRKGMEYYLEFIDKFFWVADGPLYRAPMDNPELNTYICTIPLVIQEDKDGNPSDIRDKQNDNIDYNTQNMYELYKSSYEYWHEKI